MHPILKRCIIRAGSFATRAPSDWAPNRDLTPILHGVDALTTRDAPTAVTELPGVWHKLKLLTLHSLGRCNSPTALSALHHLGKQHAVSLVETRKLQDEIARGMMSLSHIQLLMALGAVARAGAELTPALRGAGMRKMRALIGTARDEDLWMVAEVLLRHFPDHIGFCDALEARLKVAVRNLEVAGTAPGAPHAASSTMESRGGGGGQSSSSSFSGSSSPGMSLSDALLTLHVVTRIRGPSSSTAALCETLLDHFTASEAAGQSPRHLLLAFAVSAAHASTSVQCAVTARQIACELGQELAAATLSEAETVRALGSTLLTVAPAAWDESTEALAIAVANLLLQPRGPSTAVHEESFIVAAQLCSLMRHAHVTASTSKRADPVAQLLRLRLQRTVGDCAVAALPRLVKAAGLASILDAAASGYVVDRVKTKGAPFDVAQATLSALAHYGSKPSCAGSSAAASVTPSPIKGNRRATGAWTKGSSSEPQNPEDASADPTASSLTDDIPPTTAEHKATLLARLALGIAEGSTRSVDTTLHSLASLRSDGALRPEEAYVAVVACTRGHSKVPTARVPLAALAYQCAAAPMRGLSAAVRLSGHVDNAAVGALVAHSLWYCLRLVPRQAEEPPPLLDVPVTTGSELVAAWESMPTAARLNALHELGWTRRWPHPCMLRTLYALDDLKPAEACEAIRLAARYGLDSEDLLRRLAVQALGGSDPSTQRTLSPAALDELLFVTWSAFGKASVVAETLRPLVQAAIELVISADDAKSSRSEPTPPADLVRLLSAAYTSGLALPTETATRLLSKLGPCDPSSWPLRASLCAFGPWANAPATAPVPPPLKAAATAPWKETLKRLPRVSVTDAPIAAAHDAAECLLVAMHFGASSSALESLATKLAVRGVVPHVLASIAFESLHENRRAAVSELVSRGVDSNFCRALSCHNLVNMIAFFGATRERGALGVIKCEAALTLLWAALELKLDRLDRRRVGAIASTCPESCATALVPLLGDLVATARPDEFAAVVRLLSRHDPQGEWVSGAKTRFAEVAWEIDPASLEATRAALRS
jgi:hypothetical protein